MEIIGIILVLIGLGVATYGAYVIYCADFPRNNWIVEAFSSAASKPSYGLIAPNDYNPAVEREQALERTQEVIKQAENYAKASRKGISVIGLGFILQALGNILLIWPLVSEALTYEH